MNDEEPLSQQQLVNLHSAGAIVRHKSPFDGLPTPRNQSPMSREAREKWVIPFYMKPMRLQGTEFTAACAKATPAIALELLGEFNWRPRTVGARFVAVRRFFELQREISNLLLKSELCFVGEDYCHTLAALSNEEAVETLCKYLGHYLSRPDLGFDQNDAMAALQYLDEARGTNHLAPFLAPWHKAVNHRVRWTRDNEPSAQFRQEMAAIEAARRASST